MKRPKTKVVVSGCVGPRGDGYKASARRSVEAAQDYHRRQIEVFRDSDADMITAITHPGRAKQLLGKWKPVAARAHWTYR